MAAKSKSKKKSMAAKKKSMAAEKKSMAVKKKSKTETLLLTLELLELLSDNWKFKNGGIADVCKKDPNHVQVDGKGHDAPTCCYGALLASCLKSYDRYRVVRETCIAELLFPEFMPEFLLIKTSKTNCCELFLSGKAVHQFDIAVFSKVLPRGETDIRPKWQSAIGFMIINEKVGWRGCVTNREPFHSGGTGAWLGFWHWIKAYDEQQSLWIYITFALLAFAQLQEKRRDPPRSRPQWYRPRLLIQTTMNDKYLFLYEAEISCKFLASIKNCVDPDPNIWPSFKCRRIPYEPSHEFQDTLLQELVPGKKSFNKGARWKPGPPEDLV